MRTRTGIILQARRASTRLPGKALESIGPYSVLEHCLRRLIAAGVAPVVLATTTNVEDDELAAVAERLGAGVFRGSVDDVLGRFVAAAEAFDFDTVIRATADNPAVDIQAAGRTLTALRCANADYAQECGLPCGAAVEAVTASALRRSAETAQDPADREHVTTFIKKEPVVFRLVQSRAPAPLYRPDLRVTVDTREDLEYVRELFARAGEPQPSLRRLIEVAGRRGEGQGSEGARVRGCEGQGSEGQGSEGAKVRRCEGLTRRSHAVAKAGERVMR